MLWTGYTGAAQGTAHHTSTWSHSGTEACLSLPQRPSHGRGSSPRLPGHSLARSRAIWTCPPVQASARLPSRAAPGQGLPANCTAAPPQLSSRFVSLPSPNCHSSCYCQLSPHLHSKCSLTPNRPSKVPQPTGSSLLSKPCLPPTSYGARAQHSRIPCISNNTIRKQSHICCVCGLGEGDVLRLKTKRIGQGQASADQGEETGRIK